ncbi:class I tRNA ligase family protein, partial [Candidatus Roizmanbacteria bacterium]|nr:class I tRNA ligase family protein [Candidatus Roizmanbacteria bacterium]
MQKYIPANIEPKWQKKWKEEGLYLTNLSDTAKKYYVLVELPYTSGDLHMGHWFTFTMGDILARFKKRLGFNVLFPNGFDAFGLPAENAAIKHGIHPRDWTYQNMERMREQFETLGTSIDWTKTMVACDPKYYKWNQWIFLKMLEKGLAYQGKLLSNWCPVDQTVLANENVEDGKCWRCGAGVVQKEVIQWFFKITALADKLIWQDPPQADWPKHLREGQN